MRRDSQHRYHDGSGLVADLDRLEALDVASFDLSPEPPIGGMAALDSAKRLRRFVLVVAAATIAVGAIVVLAAVRL
jgi:hypothetical protein